MQTTQITPESLTSIVGGLFETDAVFVAEDSVVAIDNPRIVATYNDANGALRYAAVVELALANTLGASLTMIPPGGAEDATASGEVPSNIAENLYEVMNIASAVFTEFHHERIVLDKLLLPSDEMDAEIQAKVDPGECLLQASYEIPRYQGGKISLLKV